MDITYAWYTYIYLGYQCQTCTQVIHKKCLNNVVTICAGETNSSVVHPVNHEIDEAIAGLKLEVPHSWKGKTYHKLTFCEHCGSLLWGLYNQGMQCRSCKMDVHRRCLKRVSNFCGVDPKKLQTVSSSLFGIHGLRVFYRGIFQQKILKSNSFAKILQCRLDAVFLHYLEFMYSLVRHLFAFFFTFFEYFFRNKIRLKTLNMNMSTFS